MMQSVSTFLTILICLIAAPCAQAQEKEKPATEEAKSAAEKESSTENEKSPSELITSLIKAGKLQKASESLDEALSESGNDRSLQNLRRSLATAFSRKRNYKETANQYAKLLDSRLADPKAYPADLVGILSTARIYFPRGGRADEVLPAIEKVEEHLAKTISLTKPTRDVKSLLAVHNMKALSLQRDDAEQAEQLLRDDYKAMETLHAETNDKVSADLFALSVRNLFLSLPNGDERNDLYESHQKLARAQIDDGNTIMVGSYLSAGLSQISRLYRSHPEEAKTVMESLTDVIEEFEEDEKLERTVASYKSSMRRYESRIESALKIAAMYGKPAPEIDEDAAWVGVEKPVDLEGKVVLLDFWAIWCGPCVATFPHLKHLKEEYGDQGLEIVGVTRYYNYTWDEEAARAKRGDRDAEGDPEAEHEALQEFLASHKLAHPTVVVPKGSTMHKEYNVYGIPHAALIDRKGILRLVKVGSSSAGAEELEAKIQELLAEG